MSECHAECAWRTYRITDQLLRCVYRERSHHDDDENLINRAGLLSTQCVYCCWDNVYTLYEPAWEFNVAITLLAFWPIAIQGAPGLCHLKRGRSFPPLCKYRLGCDVSACVCLYVGDSEWERLRAHSSGWPDGATRNLFRTHFSCHNSQCCIYDIRCLWAS